MLVYRLENDDGHGPYHARSVGDYNYQLLQAHGDYRSSLSANRPGACRDIPGFQCGMLCALPSMVLLRRWFWCCWELLEEAGFLVASFEVPKERILQGSQQVAFDPEFAELISRSGFRDTIARRLL